MQVQHNRPNMLPVCQRHALGKPTFCDCKALYENITLCMGGFYLRKIPQLAKQLPIQST